MTSHKKSILQFAWLNVAKNLQHLEKRRRNSYVLCISFRFASCYIICESFAMCFLPGASFCSLLSNTHFVSAGFLAAADGCFQHPIERRRNMAGKGMQPTGCQSMFLLEVLGPFSRLAYLDYNLFFQTSNLARINLAAFHYLAVWEPDFILPHLFGFACATWFLIRQAGR